MASHTNSYDPEILGIAEYVHQYQIRSELAVSPLFSRAEQCMMAEKTPDSSHLSIY